MTNIPKQYFTFLGGEISPRLWHRADLEKYGQWFSVAENIRFDTVGAFRNRPGFLRVGKALSTNNETTKMLPFVYNNNISYIIELTNEKFRVFNKDGFITDENGEPIIFNTSFVFGETKDLRFAQSTDTLFITSGESGIWEIKRLSEDGKQWEMKEFEFSIPPVGDENTDKNKTI